MATIQDLGKVAYLQKGAYNSSTKYEVNDVVTYQGSSYVSKVNNNQGNLPTNTTYWAVVVEKPVKGVDYFTPADKQEMVDEITEDAESEFNQNAQAKTEAFNTNASDKTGAFNNNATSKTSDYDTNASGKLDAYNSNHTSKLEAYNTNHDNKISAYNTNATNKISAFDGHVSDKTDEFDSHVEDKTDEFDEHTQEMQDTIDNLEAELDKLKEREEDDRRNQLHNEVEGTEINITDAHDTYVDNLVMSKESSQVTTTGKNLANIYAIQNKTGVPTITIANDKITISNNTNTVGFATTSKKLSDICPSLNINDEVILTYDTNSSLSNKNRIYLSSADTYWNNGTSKTITQSMLDSTIILYGGYNETTVISNFMIRLASVTDNTYEPYTGNSPSPSPDYPQEVKTVKGYRNLANINIINKVPSVSNGNLVDSTGGATTELTEINNSKNYILSFDVTGNLKPYVFYYDNNQTFLGAVGDLLSGYNISTSQYWSSAKYIRLRFDAYENYSNIILNEGLTKLPYVPYGNNYVDVKVTGKNLFKLDNVGIATASNGKVVADATKGIIIDVRTVNNLYISGDYTLLDNNMVRIGYFNEYPKVDIQGIRGNITTNSVINTTNYNYILLSFPKKNISITDEQIENSFQLEKGSVATSYESYKETIVPLPLNGNEMAGTENYLDELSVDKEGNLFLNKKIGKVVLDGSENWIDVRMTNVWGYSLTINNIKPNTSNNTLTYYKSSHFIEITPNNNWNTSVNDNNFSINTDGTIRITKGSIESQLVAFKTWLSINKPILYYALATPELIDLNTKVDMRLFKGINNITNSEDANMKIRYVQDIQIIIDEMKNALLEIGGGE